MDLPPSKVVHCRNLPKDVMEQELINLAAPFGFVRGILILQNKGQGFIEMESSGHATAMLNYYTSVPANVR